MTYVVKNRGVDKTQKLLVNSKCKVDTNIFMEKRNLKVEKAHSKPKPLK